jgi:quinohemoprotein amine dehydrogenase
VNMHIGYFPVVEFTSFRRRGGRPAPGAVPLKDPVDAAVEHFTKANPLQTPEWASWRAAMREPRIAGRWIVSATQPGAGKFFGEMTIAAGASPTEFVTKTRLTSVKTGKATSFTGKMIVYAGYAWRGRSAGGEVPEVREVMALSRDQASAEGRWFWGFYQEFGFNVKLRRATGGPLISGTDVSALKAGSTATKVKIFGENLPGDLTAADIDMGAGVKVGAIAAKSPGVVEVSVDVDAKAVPGFRDVLIRGASAQAAVAVYNKVDYIKISTDSQLARLGGDRYQKGFAQFEAHGFHNGLDGKPNTADDIDLGPVAAKWTMEEFLARYDDDDVKYVGTLNDNGLFTPAKEGPNPKRKFMADNYGDVWVVASYTPAGAEKPLLARSYLVVTIPAYVRYDTPEVAQ